MRTRHQDGWVEERGGRVGVPQIVKPDQRQLGLGRQATEEAVHELRTNTSAEPVGEDDVDMVTTAGSGR